MEDLGSTFERPNIEIRHRRLDLLDRNEPVRLVEADRNRGGNDRGDFGRQSRCHALRPRGGAAGSKVLLVRMACGFQAGAGSAQCRLHVGDAGGFIQPGHGALDEEQRLGKLGFRRAEVRVC